MGDRLGTLGAVGFLVFLFDRICGNKEMTRNKGFFRQSVIMKYASQLVYFYFYVLLQIFGGD